MGHSGFIIAKGEYSIVLDPFLTGAPMAVMKPSDIKASDILLTHGHQDHLGDAVEISKNNQAKITAVMELAEYCTEQGAETIRVPSAAPGSIHGGRRSSAMPCTAVFCPTEDLSDRRPAFC